MKKLVKLSCTISEQDLLENDCIFLRTYFATRTVGRFDVSYKYQALVTYESVLDLMDAMKVKLESLGISFYSFNMTTDCLLESVPD